MCVYEWVNQLKSIFIVTLVEVTFMVVLVEGTFMMLLAEVTFMVTIRYHARRYHASGDTICLVVLLSDYI